MKTWQETMWLLVEPFGDRDEIIQGLCFVFVMTVGYAGVFWMWA